MTKIDGDEEITIQVSAAIRERTQAIDMLGKYGGVDKLALTVDEQPEDEMTPERRLAIWEAIKRIKNIDELEKKMVASAEEQAAAQGD